MNHDVLVIVIIVFIFIAILLLIRSELRKNIVSKTSYFYDKILGINKEYELSFFTRKLKFNKTYKSKASLDKAQMSDAALQYVSENLHFIESLVQEYRKYDEQYSIYEKEVKKILYTKVDYSKLILNSFLFSSLDDYIALENKMTRDIIYKNKNKLTLYVYAYYTSPKGQNHWYKDGEYTFGEIVNFINTVKKHEEYMKSAKYQRSILSDSLRYDILKRDDFTCQLCGASSKKDGVKLEVDHIIPVSKGGKTEKENLQTLCERCNRGKSNKY